MLKSKKKKKDREIKNDNRADQKERKGRRKTLAVG